MRRWFPGDLKGIVAAAIGIVHGAIGAAAAQPTFAVRSGESGLKPWLVVSMALKSARHQWLV